MKHLMMIALLLSISTGFIVAGELESSESGQILFMLEEEKMARDIYTELAGFWNLRIFSNISASEEQHRSQVQTLLDSYGLEYVELPAGEFHDVGIQDLYNELVTRGKTSVRAALEVGETVEITDIADIDSILNKEISKEWRDILERLYQGSENHLSAFRRQLSRD